MLPVDASKSTVAIGEFSLGILTHKGIGIGLPCGIGKGSINSLKLMTAKHEAVNFGAILTKTSELFVNKSSSYGAIIGFNWLVASFWFR